MNTYASLLCSGRRKHGLRACSARGFSRHDCTVCRDWLVRKFRSAEYIRLVARKPDRRLPRIGTEVPREISAARVRTRLALRGSGSGFGFSLGARRGARCGARCGARRPSFSSLGGRAEGGFCCCFCFSCEGACLFCHAVRVPVRWTQHRGVGTPT